MEGNVQPAADGVVGRVLPCLQSVAMAQIVCRLPVVKCLVAVLDGCEHGSNQIGGKEEVEGRDGLDGVGISDSSVHQAVSIGSLQPDQEWAITSFSHALQRDAQTCPCGSPARVVVALSRRCRLAAEGLMM